MPYLGVYGHVNLDYLLQVKELPRADQTVPVERELVRLGGTGGNIARAAAALGVPTALAAALGDDFPPHYRVDLERSGIDLTDLRHVAGPTPKVWIFSSARGEQSGVIDQGVMGDGILRPRLDYTMMASDWVHFTTGPPQERLDLAKEAHRIGKAITFDPGQELRYRYPGRLFEKLLNESRLFIANQNETAHALEKLGYGEPRQLLDHAPNVIETRSVHGSILYTEQETIQVPACPPRLAHPPETTGAGDVFRAGIYAALHAKKPLPEAMRWGAVTVALFLEKHGERFPSRGEVLARRDEWRD